MCAPGFLVKFPNFLVSYILFKTPRLLFKFLLYVRFCCFLLSLSTPAFLLKFTICQVFIVFYKLHPPGFLVKVTLLQILLLFKKVSNPGFLLKFTIFLKFSLSFTYCSPHLEFWKNFKFLRFCCFLRIFNTPVSLLKLWQMFL